MGPRARAPLCRGGKAAHARRPLTAELEEAGDAPDAPDAEMADRPDGDAARDGSVGPEEEEPGAGGSDAEEEVVAAVVGIDGVSIHSDDDEVPALASASDSEGDADDPPPQRAQGVGPARRAVPGPLSAAHQSGPVPGAPAPGPLP